ncbi:mucin-2 isoform X2 [Amia ocellicauda]|uniref:mucin-2 isoform X2 n=1 Tax=Amia ocellicauda TaxID=2972642 RepID=UPI003464E68C
MAVDSERGLLLLLLLSTAASLTGVAVFSTVGGIADLHCKTVIYTNCSSTTWNFNSGSQTTVELVGLGKVKNNNPERAGRLSVGSNCSLHIDRLHTQDTGLYYCQQFINGKKQGVDNTVYLVLLIIDVPPETELKAGSTVTLRCLLHTGHGPGDCSHPPYTSADVRLSWVSETGAELQGDTYFTERPCLSTLTVRLQTSDHNTQWRCDLTEGGAVRASQRHTIKLTGIPEDNTTTATTTAARTTTPKPNTTVTTKTGIPEDNTTAATATAARTTTPKPNTTTTTKTGSHIETIVSLSIVLPVALLISAVAVYVGIRRSRRPRGNQDVADPSAAADTVTYAVIETSKARERDPATAGGTEAPNTEYATVRLH